MLAAINNPIKATHIQRGARFRLRPVAWEILAYLCRRPNARDTLEGIVEWWLMEQRIRRALEESRRALAELAARGLVLARHARDGRIYYAVQSRRLDEIRQRVNAHQWRQAGR